MLKNASLSSQDLDFITGLLDRASNMDEFPEEIKP
jgi:hypothetical protein